VAAAAAAAAAAAGLHRRRGGEPQASSGALAPSTRPATHAPHPAPALRRALRPKKSMIARVGFCKKSQRATMYMPTRPHWRAFCAGGGVGWGGRKERWDEGGVGWGERKERWDEGEMGRGGKRRRGGGGEVR
jgi:hypothetical protein